MVVLQMPAVTLHDPVHDTGLMTRHLTVSWPTSPFVSQPPRFEHQTGVPIVWLMLATVVCRGVPHYPKTSRSIPGYARLLPGAF
eukprot:scaffold6931_cov443-Prasinococcus_capsulatus_cf.AAC.4